MSIADAPRCGRKTRRGGLCSQPAICGPNGERWPCRMHGGKGIAKIAQANLKHGRYARCLKGNSRLAELAEEARADPKLLDLREDIAFARALLHLYFEKKLMDDDGLQAEMEPTLAPPAMTHEDIQTGLDLLERLARLIKRHCDMEHQERYQATSQKVAAWIAQACEAMIRVLERFIIDPDQLQEAKAAIAREVAQIGASAP